MSVAFSFIPTWMNHLKPLTGFQSCSFYFINHAGFLSTPNAHSPTTPGLWKVSNAWSLKRAKRHSLLCRIFSHCLTVHCRSMNCFNYTYFEELQATDLIRLQCKLFPQGRWETYRRNGFSFNNCWSRRKRNWKNVTMSCRSLMTELLYCMRRSRMVVNRSLKWGTTILYQSSFMFLSKY